MNYKIFLASIFLLTLTLVTRGYGFNWDAGFHLHPDERAIILYTLPLHVPQNISSFLSPDSSLNPHFFAYGSFPLYLLSSISFIAGKISPFLATYDGMQFVGRAISILAEIGSVLLLFLIGKQIRDAKTGFLAACFYIFSTLPLQLGHFYTVDPLLTLFTLLCLSLLLTYIKRPHWLFLIGVGVSFGLALATKISASMLLIPMFATLLVSEFSHFPNISDLSSSVFWGHSQRVIRRMVLILITTSIIFICFEPYAFLDFSSFWRQTQEQSRMTKDAFTFPYTLQYVTIIPYVYHISQIVLWGQGFLLGAICLGGTAFVTVCFNKLKEKKALFILLSFFWMYFLVVGKFAVAFMRYMLPLYPLLCLFGAICVLLCLQKLNNLTRATFVLLLLLGVSVWPASFLHIYSSPHTRVQATYWILDVIPPGKTIAIEHWDDQLPLTQAALYPFETLELYNPDTPAKWQTITKQLENADYLILASNRLSTPLQKLTDCNKLKPHPCYLQTAQYYQDLFAGNLNFKKVAEFTNYPTVPFLGIEITDQDADESFTVYDHPKVIIFQKEK